MYFTKYLLSKEQPRIGKFTELVSCSSEFVAGDLITNDGVVFHTCSKTQFELRNSLNTFFKIIGKISKDAIWVTEKVEIKEDDFVIYYGVDVEKVYSNGKINHTVVFENLQDKEIIQDIVERWAENEGSGFRSGWELTWGEPKIDHVKIKCPTCKLFH